MNERERFLNNMHFKAVDRVTKWEPMAIWDATWKRWHDEGLTDMYTEQIGEHGAAAT